MSYSYSFLRTKSFIALQRFSYPTKTTLREKILPCSGVTKPSRAAPPLTQAGVWGFLLLVLALELEWECCAPLSEWTAPVFTLQGQRCGAPACRLAPPKSWGWAAFMQRQRGSFTPGIILL